MERGPGACGARKAHEKGPGRPKTLPAVRLIGKARTASAAIAYLVAAPVSTDMFDAAEADAIVGVNPNHLDTSF